jgi:hypothetical protein
VRLEGLGQLKNAVNSSGIDMNSYINEKVFNFKYPKYDGSNYLNEGVETKTRTQTRA